MRISGDPVERQLTFCVAPIDRLKPDLNGVHDVDPVNAVGMIAARLHRDNRYEGVSGRTEPRYEIRSFDELVPVLEQDFGLVLPPP